MFDPNRVNKQIMQRNFVNFSRAYLPSTWKWMRHPDDVTSTDLVFGARCWYEFGIRHFANNARIIAEKVAAEKSGNVHDRVAQTVIGEGLRYEADQHYNPVSGRPDRPLYTALPRASDILGPVKFAQEKRWNVARGILANYFDTLPEDLEGMFKMWFGQGGHWMSVHEKLASLEAIDEFRKENFCGFELNDMADALAAVVELRQKLEAMPAPVSPISLANFPAEDWLRGWGIKNTRWEMFVVLDREFSALNAALQRLRGTEPPPIGEVDAVAFVAMAEVFLEELGSPILEVTMCPPGEQAGSLVQVRPDGRKMMLAPVGAWQSKNRIDIHRIVTQADMQARLFGGPQEFLTCFGRNYAASMVWIHRVQQEPTPDRVRSLIRSAIRANRVARAALGFHSGLLSGNEVLPVLSQVYEGAALERMANVVVEMPIDETAVPGLAPLLHRAFLRGEPNAEEWKNFSAFPMIPQHLLLLSDERSAVDISEGDIRDCHPILSLVAE